MTAGAPDCPEDHPVNLLTQSRPCTAAGRGWGDCMQANKASSGGNQEVMVHS